MKSNYFGIKDFLLTKEDIENFNSQRLNKSLTKKEKEEAFKAHLKEIGKL